MRGEAIEAARVFCQATSIKKLNHNTMFSLNKYKGQMQEIMKRVQKKYNLRDKKVQERWRKLVLEEAKNCGVSEQILNQLVDYMLHTKNISKL